MFVEDWFEERSKNMRPGPREFWRAVLFALCQIFHVAWDEADLR